MITRVIESQFSTSFIMFPKQESVYDKQFKYGDINKSIAEVCYFIEKHAKRLNDFYIIYPDYVHEFMSYFVINNQWGLGAEFIYNTPTENLKCLEESIKER